jgi:ATP-binding cassette subfamily B protein
MVREDRWRLVVGAVFFLFKASPVWAMPLVIAAVIDLLASPSPDTVNQLLLYVFVLAVIVAQNIPTHVIFARQLSTATRNLETNLRSAIVRRLQHLSISHYTRTSTGALQSKLVRDVESIQQLVMGSFEPLLSTIAGLAVPIAVTAVRAPWFLLVYLAIVPLAVVIVYTMRKPINERNTQLRREMENLSSRLIEMTALVPVTRAHAEEQHEIEKVERRLTQVRDAGLRLDYINSIFGSTSWVIMQLLAVTILGLSAWAYLTQWFPIQLGDIVLLTGYFNGLVNASLGLLGLMPQMAKGFEAIRSVGEILESPDLEHNEGKLAVSAVRGQITFEDVGFRYADPDPAPVEADGRPTRDQQVSDFSLTVEAGETIAIVGPSGAGKSTILNLVVGFLRPTEGRLLLDGRDMASLDLRTYRRFISVVPQESVLFAGTIRENVTYGGHDVSEAQFLQALRAANAHEFVMALPEGPDTIVGERGARLSGGQKQRLAIARALIRDPRVLILDEATSALDTGSELLIQEALARLMRGRTVFVVAHRLSTIRDADRIVVMDRGRIVEIGSHTQLMSSNGPYRRMVQTAT